MKLILLLSLLALMSFSGCSRIHPFSECPNGVCIETVREVHIPQKCIVPAPTGCKWQDALDSEVGIKMLECIIELKQNIRVCQ